MAAKRVFWRSQHVWYKQPHQVGTDQWTPGVIVEELVYNKKFKVRHLRDVTVRWGKDPMPELKRRKQPPVIRSIDQLELRDWGNMTYGEDKRK